MCVDTQAHLAYCVSGKGVYLRHADAARAAARRGAAALFPPPLLFPVFAQTHRLNCVCVCLSLQGGAAELLVSRYAAPLSEHHDDSHLTKFELLLEASLDLEAVPQEYLISAAYDSRLQVMGRGEGRVAKLCGCC